MPANHHNPIPHTTHGIYQADSQVYMEEQVHNNSGHFETDQRVGCIAILILHNAIIIKTGWFRYRDLYKNIYRKYHYFI